MGHSAPGSVRAVCKRSPRFRAAEFAPANLGERLAEDLLLSLAGWLALGQRRVCRMRAGFQRAAPTLLLPTAALGVSSARQPDSLNETSLPSVIRSQAANLAPASLPAPASARNPASAAPARRRAALRLRRPPARRPPVQAKTAPPTPTGPAGRQHRNPGANRPPLRVRVAGGLSGRAGERGAGKVYHHAGRPSESLRKEKPGAGFNGRAAAARMFPWPADVFAD